MRPLFAVAKFGFQTPPHPSNDRPLLGLRRWVSRGPNLSWGCYRSRQRLTIVLPTSRSTRSRDCVAPVRSMLSQMILSPVMSGARL
jgi:hypothetical protein